MKSAVVLSLIAAVVAQDIAALAQCGQTCANNMMAAGKAAELGCKQGDLKCLCSNANFSYGLRDCSHAICSQQDANKVVEYGMKVCEGAGVVITGGNGGNGGASQTGGSSQTGGAGDASQTGGASQSGGSSETGGNGGSGGNGGAQVTTIYSTATGTDGQVVTTPIATSTIQGGNGAAQVTTIYSTLIGTDGQVITTAVATSTVEGGNGGAVVSTYTTNGSQVVVTLSTQVSQPSGSGTESGGASQAPSGTETAGESGSATAPNGGGSPTSAAPSSSSTGFAAQVTAAPGLLAAAGLAALLF